MRQILQKHLYDCLIDIVYEYIFPMVNIKKLIDSNPKYDVYGNVNIYVAHNINDNEFTYFSKQMIKINGYYTKIFGIIDTNKIYDCYFIYSLTSYTWLNVKNIGSIMINSFTKSNYSQILYSSERQEFLIINNNKCRFINISNNTNDFKQIKQYLFATFESKIPGNIATGIILVNTITLDCYYKLFIKKKLLVNFFRKYVYLILDNKLLILDIKLRQLEKYTISNMRKSELLLINDNAICVY